MQPRHSNNMRLTWDLMPIAFNSCIDSGKYADKVNNDYKDGTNYGVTGTPTFFIGNDQKGYMRLEGAQPFPAFQQELDSELS